LKNMSASPVWPPTGIALAALLVLGLRVWPAIFVGAFLVNDTTTGHWQSSLAIAVGNTLEGVFRRLARTAVRARAPRLRTAAGRLQVRAARRAGGDDGQSDDRRDESCRGRARAVAVERLRRLLADLVARRRGWRPRARAALVLWCTRPVIARPRETAALLAAALLVGMLVLSSPLPLAFLCLPVVVWAGFRFGPREAATAVLVLSVFAILGTLSGTGSLAVATDARVAARAAGVPGRGRGHLAVAGRRGR
jgi:hypothetical protein